MRGLQGFRNNVGPIISHNNGRVKIGSSNPDFDPFLIISFSSIKDAGDEH